MEGPTGVKVYDVLEPINKTAKMEGWMKKKNTAD